MGDSVVVVTATVPSGVSDKFGDYGGWFVPEALMHALDQLAVEFERAREDPEFRRELDSLLADYVGRPSPLTSADRFAAECGGAEGPQLGFAANLVAVDGGRRLNGDGHGSGRWVNARGSPNDY